MNLSVLKKLNLKDYQEVRINLQDCKDSDEAYRVLNDFERSLDNEIATLERTVVDPQLLLDELHRYNDMKDMTQAAIGTLANLQGNTIAKVHEQFHVILD